MQRNKQKTLAFLTCATFVLAAFFSILFIIQETDHDCTGGDCPVCVCIHQAEQMLKNIGTGAIRADGWIFARLSQMLAVPCVFLFILCTSLINQKVRLNN